MVGFHRCRSGLAQQLANCIQASGFDGRNADNCSYLVDAMRYYEPAAMPVREGTEGISGTVRDKGLTAGGKWRASV
jgi:hypothetical protein